MKEPLITCDTCGKHLTEQVWTGTQILCAECWEAKEMKMKQVTIRECADRRWCATYEVVSKTVVNPVDFAVGDTQLEAAKALMARCPGSQSVPGANVKVVRL